MGLGMLEIIIIGITVWLYFMLMRTMRSKLKRGSRAAQFKVGGSRLSIRRDEDVPAESGKKKAEVSLRNKPRFGRRFQ